MKIAEIKSLHADAGGRAFDYLKITTDAGLVGWSEYNESFGGVGVAAAIDHLARIPTVVLDPKVTHTSRLARVHITTAVTGMSLRKSTRTSRCCSFDAIHS